MQPSCRGVLAGLSAALAISSLCAISTLWVPQHHFMLPCAQRYLWSAQYKANSRAEQSGLVVSSLPCTWPCMALDALELELNILPLHRR